MSIFGKITKAVSGAVKAVGHACKEVGKQVGIFVEGVVSGFALKPIAGVVSLFSKDLAHKIRLPNQDQVDHSFMGKVGSFAGTALGFVWGTSFLRGVGLGATAARAAIGAVEGLAGSAEGPLWDKIKGAGFGALTAGAAGHLGDKVAGWVQKGKDAVLHPLVEAGAPRALTQGVDRVINAEVSSLVRTGHFAGLKEVLPAAAVSTVVTEAGHRINDGIDRLTNKLPHNEVTTALNRVLHVEQNSLAHRGRFAEPGMVISQAIPDSVNREIDRQIARLDNSHNRLGETAGRFLHNEATMLQVHGRLIDPQTGLIKAAAREFSPEIEKIIEGAHNMHNPAGEVMSRVLRTEADSLQRYGRLHNPGAALEKAIMHEVRPAIDRYEHRLPPHARSTVDDMLKGFTVNGIDGVTASAERTLGQNLQKYAERILPDRFHGPEHIDARRERIDNREPGA